MGMTLEISGEIEDLRETIQDLRFQMVENAKAAEAYVAAAPIPAQTLLLRSCSAVLLTERGRSAQILSEELYKKVSTLEERCTLLPQEI